MNAGELTVFVSQLNSETEIKILTGGQVCDVGAILFTGEVAEVIFVPAAGGDQWLKDISTLS